MVSGITSHNFEAITPNLNLALAKVLEVSKSVVDVTFVKSLENYFDSRRKKQENTTQPGFSEKAVIKANVVGFNEEDVKNYLKCMGSQTFVISMNEMIKEDQRLALLRIHVEKSGKPIVGLRYGKV